MKIVIPSYNRYDKRFELLDRMPEEFIKDTFVCVREEQVKLYERTVKSSATIVPLTKSQDIQSTRNEILELFDGNIMMIDDDTTFREWNGKGFVQSYQESNARLFHEMRRLLESGFVHASVAQPVVGARTNGKLIHNTRYGAVLAYNTDMLKRLGVTFRVPYMEDMELALNLTRQGFPSAIITKWIIKTPPINSNAGGCSTMRNSKNHNKSAKKLAKAYHPFVKAKKSRAWKGMENRLDVVVSWKKLFEKSPIKHIPRGYNV